MNMELAKKELVKFLEEHQSNIFYQGAFVMDSDQLSVQDDTIIGISFEDSCHSQDEFEWGFMSELEEKLMNMSMSWNWYSPIELHIYSIM